MRLLIARLYATYKILKRRNIINTLDKTINSIKSDGLVLNIDCYKFILSSLRNLESLSYYKPYDFTNSLNRLEDAINKNIKMNQQN